MSEASKKAKERWARWHFPMGDGLRACGHSWLFDYVDIHSMFLRLDEAHEVISAFMERDRRMTIACYRQRDRARKAESTSVDMLKALEAAEWGGYYQGGPACSVCGGLPGHHTPGCILDKAIKKARGEKE